MENKSKKAVILVLIDWFEPAYRAGGPITSCVNFVNACCKQYTIKILTSAYDLDGTKVVNEANQSRWVKYGDEAEVYFATKSELNYGFISGVIQQEKPDFLYCNGMFSVTFTIFPLLEKFRNKTSAKLVLAPRGMLKPTALAYKAVKKSVFLSLFKISGIARKVKFHATDEEERKDVYKNLGMADVFVAGNFPAPVSRQPTVTPKYAGKLNLLFLGRIHEIKQLHYLLDRLLHIDDEIMLTIIGPMEDANYWQTCLNKIKLLPPNITVEYIGEKNPSEIKAIFTRQHVMALPTKGENFGHAIFESFANGKPVIISDRTPWLNLEQEQTGFDCQLDDPESFVHAIQLFAGMDQLQYAQWSHNAFIKAEKFLADSGLFDKYQQLFS
jgi:glycosyltransferase involved in cell wall biosynthesis